MTDASKDGDCELPSWRHCAGTHCAPLHLQQVHLLLGVLCWQGMQNAVLHVLTAPLLQTTSDLLAAGVGTDGVRRALGRRRITKVSFVKS